MTFNSDGYKNSYIMHYHINEDPFAKWGNTPNANIKEYKDQIKFWLGRIPSDVKNYREEIKKLLKNE